MKNENSKFGFLGEELRKARKEKGLSQEELADKINVSRQSIHLWEAGKIIPDFENIINLCNALEITTDRLTVGLDNYSYKEYVFKDDGTYTITNYEIKINNTTNEDIEFLNINNYEKIN